MGQTHHIYIIIYNTYTMTFLKCLYYTSTRYIDIDHLTEFVERALGLKTCPTLLVGCILSLFVEEQ